MKRAKSQRHADSLKSNTRSALCTRASPRFSEHFPESGDPRGREKERAGEEGTSHNASAGCSYLRWHVPVSVDAANFPWGCSTGGLPLRGFKAHSGGTLAIDESARSISITVITRKSACGTPLHASRATADQPPPSSA